MTLRAPTRLTRDPSRGQIAAVGAFVLAGAIRFGIETAWWRPAAALGAANLTQRPGARVCRISDD